VRFGQNDAGVASSRSLHTPRGLQRNRRFRARRCELPRVQNRLPARLEPSRTIGWSRRRARARPLNSSAAAGPWSTIGIPHMIVCARMNAAHQPSNASGEGAMKSSILTCRSLALAIGRCPPIRHPVDELHSVRAGRLTDRIDPILPSTAIPPHHAAPDSIGFPRVTPRQHLTPE